MNKINFTARAVEKLPAGHHRDTQERGLGISVQPNTQAKSYVWYRKVRGNQKRWVTLGDVADLTVEEARRKAGELNVRLARWKESGSHGDDPFARPDEVTLDILLDAYIEQRLKGHAKHPDKAEKILRYQIEKYLHAWRPRSMTSIYSEDVAALHRKLGADNGHRTANKVVKTIRALYRFGVRAKLFKCEDPTDGIQFFRENQRTRFLQPDELPRLWAALAKAPNPDLRDFVNLSLWTGARKSDVLSARWQEISLDDNRWTIPNPKSRVPYTIPLTGEAVAILKMRLRNRIEGSPWVFPSVGASGHIVDLKGAWKKLLIAAGLHFPGNSELKITQHDLRRTQGSWQAGLGSSLLVIGASLGHQSTDATQVYSRLNLDPVRVSMTAANAAILGAMKKKPKLLKAANRG